MVERYNTMKSSPKNLRDYGFTTDKRVYVVAEIGLNHSGSIETAKRLIASASHTGADAVKFQTYVTEKRAAKDSPIYGILKKCELPFKDFKELKDYASNLNLEFFSTPFDEESVDLLEQINCNIHKVASFDVVNKKLLHKIANTGKTIIISTGMSDLPEVEAAYKIINNKTDKIALLHCVSAYPLKEEDANLANIFTLKEKFDCVVGYSDHTAGIFVPLCAVNAGAQVIEKHYKIDGSMDCVDGPVSITEIQMKEMVKDIRRQEDILGDFKLGLKAAEKGCQVYRRHSK